ncbi:squalene/phytoene synthase family protein [Roseicyclus marinus]|uniref:squalene/phytoene synthase family protein n=1 Tax=Roseicyclus marinus TaxID=2161673 RepID=UPI00240F36A7|nr:squalene/phytoene synthase family protein [Roseicyclus marinus]MDG3040088.1 squalene/phytoene synthase family protein [Roseicyclus marinus]
MSLQSCAEMVARGAPDRFRAAMASPVAARRVLFPLYAFNIEVSRAPWVTEEPLIAEMRLQFWRDVVEEIAAGKKPRAHEVAQPLAAAIPADLFGPLDALVAARRWDIHKDPFEDRAAFDAYIGDTSAPLVTVAARALGATPEAEPVLHDAGWAYGLAGFLRAIPALEAAGRVPLVEGTHDALRDLAKDGLARLTRARAARAIVPRAAAPALYAGWRAEATLKSVLADPGLVAAGRLPGAGLRDSLRLARLAATGRW